MVRRVNARTLTTKQAAAREFVHHASPYVLGVSIALPVALRTRLGGVRLQDGVAVGAVVVVQPFVEWLLHRRVLHARPRRFAGLSVDPGAAHRGHHLNPDDVAGALLGFGYAVADTAMVAAAIALAALAMTPFAGAIPTSGLLTAIAAGEIGLATYEWTHLLVHTGYRPRSRWVRRLRANHRRHHFRDDTRSFGITTMIADRLLRTSPR